MKKRLLDLSPIGALIKHAAKNVVHPRGVMNPGVLLDPIGRRVGIIGATASTA